MNDSVTRNGFNNPIKKGFNPTSLMDKLTLITIQKKSIKKNAIRNLTANKSIIKNSFNAKVTNGGPEPNPITAINIAK